MKVNENTIYIFLLGILAGIICMQCVNHFRKSPKDVYVDNFEYEKVLGHGRMPHVFQRLSLLSI